MNIKRVLLLIGAIACVVVGFLAARYLGDLEREKELTRLEQLHEQESTELRQAAEQWTDAVARAQGEAVLRAFVAGISPAVLAGRRESIEIAGVSLLRIPGVAGIHVLGLNGEVLYSSDAKLTTTGEAGNRGAWAIEASELVSRPSTRPGVVDVAMPIVSSGKRLAIAWLEYDEAAVQEGARPSVFSG